jgi:acyl transferase domain-containing protein/phosphopantetheinyl transferase/acyl carrier protein
MNIAKERPRTTTDDVAIVGMSCVFPGAPDLKTYWRNIVGKVDSVSDAPSNWGADVYYDPDSTSNDRVYCRRGGFLHDLASFDPLEYGVMPTSVEGGEPDHFLALRVAHEALADAGYRRDGKVLEGDRVEVILGRGGYINLGLTNLVQHGLIVDQTLRLLTQLHPEHTEEELAQIRQDLKSSLPPFNSEMAPGLVPNILSGRIANRLDLMGPNFTIDAACASSLIAIERAVQDLLDHRCNMVLTGGIHCSSPPPIFMVFCQLNALSRRGRIQPFSDEADGTLLGEGLGMIVLKRSADAMRDGDRIYAVIKAVGSASDGRALGLLTPRVEGEELAMRRAYEASGISPTSIGLLEAHGTGTAVGDQTEAEALTRVFGLRDGHPPSCALGSVKSMISHLIPAAGIAGIIKTALALHYRVLPPTLHCEHPNPKLGLDRTPLYINSETRPWIHGLPTPRRAGVNAFGFGGINAHAILEEFPSVDPATESDGGPRWDSEVFILHAESRKGLMEKCNRLQTMISEVAEHHNVLCDLAYTVNSENDSSDGSDDSAGFCLAIVASTAEDLHLKLIHCVKRLQDLACRNIKDAGGIYFFERMLAREGKMAFLFPGEGSQYLNMLADLCLRIPLVRARFDLIDRAFASHPRKCLPSQVIFPPPIPSDDETRKAQERRLQEMDFAAEAVFAANHGFTDLLRELRIHPDMVVGHSGGEISALLAAGVIRVDSNAELINNITDINHLYTQLSFQGVIPGGSAFAVSGADREAVIDALRSSNSHLQIGMDNCPHQVVLCGREGSVDKLLSALRKIGAVATPMPFQRPYHTPEFEPYCAKVRPFFDRLKMSCGDVPIYSAATTARFPSDPEKIRVLAARQTALPVRFRETIEAMHDDGARVFVEVGPKGTLTSFVSDTLRTRPHTAIPCDLPQMSGVLQLNRLLAQLSAHGVSMRLDPLYERRGARKISWEVTEPVKSAPRNVLNVETGLAHLRLKDRTRIWTRLAPSIAAPVEHRSSDSFNATAFSEQMKVPDGVPVHRAEMRNPQTERHADAAMHAYLRSMDQFLTVQQEVMQAYLNSSPATMAEGQLYRMPEVDGDASVLPTPPPSEYINQPSLNHSQLSQIPTPSPSQNGEENAIAPNRNLNLLSVLRDVISERTGYPTDMLEISLNLEADLGVDSIKRIEILGAFHRQTGLIGHDLMEDVSKLKTIGQILEFLEWGSCLAAETGKQGGIGYCNRNANTPQSTPRRDHQPTQIGVGNPSGPSQVRPASVLPLMGKIESHTPRHKVAFVRDFDLANDLFLRHHALGGHVSDIDPSLTGLPLIPLTMTVEMMAEAAAFLVPDRTLIEVRTIRGLRWLALDHGTITLRVVAELEPGQAIAHIQPPVPDKLQERVYVRVYVDEEANPAAEGYAIFADDFPVPPTAQSLTLRSERASRWTPERLYRDHMFHGPSFQGIEAIHRWGENGLSATLISLPTSRLFSGEKDPTFLTDPVLMDAAGQMVGYWAAEHFPTSFNVFPHRIQSVRFYQPPLSQSRRAHCHAHIGSITESQILSDIDVLDESGRLHMQIHGWDDLRVDLPEPCYRLCLSPRGVYLSTARQVNATTTLRSIELTDLPSLTAFGGIWLRALAHALLSANERQQWRQLGGNERRRVEWLLGRCCAKDAVRQLAMNFDKSEPLAADVEIVSDENGRPLVASGGFRPAISISHADGVAFAAATLLPGTDIGVDVQRLDSAHDGFEELAFSRHELALVPYSDKEMRRESLLRLWCAKEAAAKALGYGMLGGPRSLIVRSFDPEDGAIIVHAAGPLAEYVPENEPIHVTTSRQEYLIVASCLHRTSKETHELSISHTHYV